MASENLKRYIWETQIVPQLGYSFSDIHSFGYGLVALQMLNLEHLFPSVFWQTSCLSVNASADEESESNKSTNYGKIAAAISKMKQQGINVSLPLINKAKFGFTPDVDNNEIVFGLKGINGIGDVAHELIKHRPYSSFDDFYTRVYETKVISKGQFIKLIKAGSFNEFNSQIEIMKQFLVKEVIVKDNLNGQNLPRVVSLGLLDTTELIRYKHLYNFKSHIAKSVHEVVAKPKDRIFILDSISQAFFFNSFTEESIIGWEGDKPLISEKKFKKEYDKQMEEFMEMMNDREFLRNYNNAQFYELWDENCNGSVAKWQMESISYYDSDHELQNVDYNKYGITNFFDLSEIPVVLSENTGKNGRVYQNNQLFTIVGTVLDKNKNNHTITVLTPEGVVTCKTYGGAFSQYDRQISSSVNGKKTVLEKSWFVRGNLILLSGFRRQDQFVLKAPKGQHTINLIQEVREDGSLGLQAERTRV